MGGKGMTWLLVAALALFVLSNTVFVVKETERAVMLQFGEVVNPDIQPGLHVKVPFVNNVRKFEARLMTVDSTPERFFTQELTEVAREEYGVEVLDVRVKQIDLPPDVSESVYRRMNAEREKEAREHRALGQELAEGIRAAADREVTVLEANAYRDAQLIRGEGDAQATNIYASAFNTNPEFYSFTRSLRAYRESFQNNGDIMLIQPDSDFFRYLKDASGSK